MYYVVDFSLFFLMIPRPPRSTRTDPPCPYTTLFLSARMQFAEIAKHVLRAELNGAGAAGMEPARRAGHDLQLVGGDAERRKQREGVRLGIKRIEDRKSTRLNSSH